MTRYDEVYATVFIKHASPSVKANLKNIGTGFAGLGRNTADAAKNTAAAVAKRGRAIGEGTAGLAKDVAADVTDGARSLAKRIRDSDAVDNTRAGLERARKKIKAAF